MGLCYGEWGFAAGDAPGIDAIADALRRSTGLQVDIGRLGDGSLDWLGFPALRSGFVMWDIMPDHVVTHSFVPGNPYAWEHLDAVLTAAGGVNQSERMNPIRAPSCAWLRVSWNVLSPRNQRILPGRRWLPLPIGPGYYDRLRPP